MYGQNPYPYPPPPPPIPPKRSMLPWIIAGAAVLLGTCGGGLAFCAYTIGSAADKETGVTMGTQVGEKTIAALRKRGLLREGEVLVVFYDATVSLDMSEVALLTNKRIVSTKPDVVASIDLADVATARHTTEGIIGDVLEVSAVDGRRLRIEIAHLNNGASFVNALDDELAKQPAKVKVERRVSPK
jgi:hypothetical protein